MMWYRSRRPATVCVSEVKLNFTSDFCHPYVPHSRGEKHDLSPRRSPLGAFLLLFCLLLTPLVSRADTDFNADNNADMLWQNTTTGDIAYWYMNGTNRLSYATLSAAVPTNFKLVGTPDLNGDGKPDILWQDTTTGDVIYWYMDGITRTGFGTLWAAVPLNFKIIATPDLNGDGKPDILWRDTTTGDVIYWYMDGITRTGLGTLWQGVALAWELVAANYTTGTSPYLLWQNSGTGEVAYWTMSGITRTNFGMLTTEVPASQKIMGLSDLNRDGQADIVLQDSATGEVVYWLMNGVQRLSIGRLVNKGPTPWVLAGLRGNSIKLSPLTPVLVSGKITLQSSVDQAQPISFLFGPVKVGARFSRTVLLNQDGSFTLTNIPPDKYIVWIKGAKWLAMNVLVDATKGNVSNVNATLKAGDVNNDNIVGIDDLGLLTLAFNTDANSLLWNANADLNGDGKVDIDDLGLLSLNFDTAGDEVW